jgi:UDPglucose 6-dehydrogenase
VARIFIVGAGAEGTATGRALLEAGHVVTFVDPSRIRVTELCADSLDARCSLDLVGEPESVVMLCHRTTDTSGRWEADPAGSPGIPLSAPGYSGGFDLSALRAGVVDVARALTGADARHIVVLRSSVPPGTTRHLVGPLLERVSGRPESLAFAVAAMPMFLRSAAVDADARHPRLTLIGANSLPVAHRLRELLVPPSAAVRMFDDPAAVELAKCVHSALHATRISLWNEVWQMCERLGIDQDDVADAVAGCPDARPGGLYGTRGGAPYAGDRLPRDTRGLLGVGAQLGLDMPLLSAVVQVNDEFEERLARELDTLTSLS